MEYRYILYVNDEYQQKFTITARSQEIADIRAQADVELEFDDCCKVELFRLESVAVWPDRSI